MHFYDFVFYIMIEFNLCFKQPLKELGWTDELWGAGRIPGSNSVTEMAKGK
jgi:hypothetical protein